MRSTINIIGEYIMSNGVESAKTIINLFFERGRITVKERNWLISVWIE